MATGAADRSDITGGTDARDIRGAGLTTQYLVHKAKMTTRPDAIDVRSPDAPSGVAIPGIPAGPATDMVNTLGSQPTVTRSHMQGGKRVKADVSVRVKRNADIKLKDGTNG